MRVLEHPYVFAAQRVTYVSYPALKGGASCFFHQARSPLQGYGGSLSTGVWKLYKKVSERGLLAEGDFRPLYPRFCKLPRPYGWGSLVFKDEKSSVSYPSAKASGLPASSTRLDPHYRVTEASVSTGVYSPRTAGTRKEFLVLTLKAFAPSEPQKRQTFSRLIFILLGSPLFKVLEYS